MDDPLLDQINAVTLENLKDSVIFETLFDDGLYEYATHQYEWQRKAHKRLRAMGVKKSDILSIIDKMGKQTEDGCAESK